MENDSERWNSVDKNILSAYNLNMEDTLLTVQEAAASLGVTDGAVRLALSQGRLPSVEKYGRKLVAWPDLDVYRQRTQPGGVKRVGRPRKGREQAAG